MASGAAVVAESPTSRADVVVIGGGVLGASVFHELADCGASVLLVERDRGGLGTTAWSGGIVRCYHDDRTQLERAVEGWTYFQEFGDRTGVDVPFVESGFLYVPHPSRLEHARALVGSTTEAPMEWLTSAEADRRFGHLLNRSVDGAAWEPRAGYLDPLDVTRAYLAAGRRKGGRVLEGVEAHGVLRSGGRLRGVNTGIGAISADTVVLATGAATPQLLDSWGIGHDLWAQAIQVELRLPDGPVDGHPAYMDDEYDINGRPDPESSGMLLGHPTGQRAGRRALRPGGGRHRRGGIAARGRVLGLPEPDADRPGHGGAGRHLPGRRRRDGPERLQPLMDLVVRHFHPLMDKYRWGPSGLYAIAGMRDVHPTYVQRIEENTALAADEKLSALGFPADASGSRFSETVFDEALAHARA